MFPYAHWLKPELNGIYHGLSILIFPYRKLAEPPYFQAQNHGETTCFTSPMNTSSTFHQGCLGPYRYMIPHCPVSILVCYTIHDNYPLKKKKKKLHPLFPSPIQNSQKGPFSSITVWSWPRARGTIHFCPGTKSLSVLAQGPCFQHLDTAAGKIQQEFMRIGMLTSKHMGLSENSVPLHPMVKDHYPY